VSRICVTIRSIHVKVAYCYRPVVCHQSSVTTCVFEEPAIPRLIVHYGGQIVNHSCEFITTLTFDMDGLGSM